MSTLLPTANESVIGSPAKAAISRATSARDFFTPLESVRGIGALLVLLIHSCVWLAGDNWSLLSRTLWQLETADELVRRITPQTARRSGTRRGSQCRRHSKAGQ